MEKYKLLLSRYLNEARADDEGNQRDMYTRSELQDMFLDLWLALNEDLTVDAPAEPVSV